MIETRPGRKPDQWRAVAARMGGTEGLSAFLRFAREQDQSLANVRDEIAARTGIVVHRSTVGRWYRWIS